jgi:hypothetical protein
MENTRHSSHILMKHEFSRQIFEKHSNSIYHKNPSSGSRVLPYRRKNTHTYMTNLILAFRNFANAPNSTNGKVKTLQMTVFWILTTFSNVSNERAASIFMVIEPESGVFRSECEDDTYQLHSNVARKMTNTNYDQNTCHLLVQ